MPTTLRFLESLACRRRHLSHLKSSIRSFLSRPSKHLFSDVCETCGTLRVNVTNIDVEGLGSKPHTSQVIWPSSFPSNGKTSSANVALTSPFVSDVLGSGEGMSPLVVRVAGESASVMPKCRALYLSLALLPA